MSRDTHPDRLAHPDAQRYVNALRHADLWADIYAYADDSNAFGKAISHAIHDAFADLRSYGYTIRFTSADDTPYIVAYGL